MLQALDLLAELGAGAAVIAGGQELMPVMNSGVYAPTVLVDIGALPDLSSIQNMEDTISIGALCTHRQIELNAAVAAAVPLLAKAVAQIGGGWQVRNRGTIGGNIVSLHPLYDVVPTLLALDARVEVHTNDGMTRRPLADVVQDTQQGLGSSAILTRIEIPSLQQGSGWGYAKLKGSHGAYASANAASVLRTTSDGRLMNCRVVIGAVTQLPVDVTGVLAEFEGARLTATLLNRMSRQCSDAIGVALDDQRGDAQYRKSMAGVIAKRSIHEAYARAVAPLATA